jgi:integrase/recombinase XerC
LIALLVEQGYDPTDAERIAPKDDSVSPRRALGDADLGRFNAAARKLRDPALRAILLLLPVTGLRVSEVCGLRLDAFAATSRANRVNNTPRVRARVVGKGNKPREVPFGRRGTAILAEYLPQRSRSESVFLFVGPRGGRITPAMVQRATKRIGKQIGLPSLTPHVLRHQFATRAAVKGWDLHTLQAALGHGKAGSKRIPRVTLTYIDLGR